MPGLRHAHTLQQLSSFVGTHPRESIKQNSYNCTLQNNKPKQRHNIIETRNNKYSLKKRKYVIDHLVVVVCEHGVSPAFSKLISSIINLKSSNLILQSSGLIFLHFTLISRPSFWDN